MADPTSVNGQITDLVMPTARRIKTAHQAPDLIVPDAARTELDLVGGWLKHRATDDKSGLLPNGYRCLFHGPAGTGKTLAATVLGQQSGVPVYRIDLSQIISKYIGETEKGETEKKLDRLFEEAQNQDWILLFDEADALFGKRTRVVDAADRFAGSRESLFRRIEEHSGAVILEAREESTIAEAFAWRLQSRIQFSMPEPDQCLSLWRLFTAASPLELATDVDLDRLAAEPELSGGDIRNRVLQATLRARARGAGELSTSDLARPTDKKKRVGFAS